MEVDSATESLQSSTTGSPSLVSTASSIADEQGIGEETISLFTTFLRNLIGKQIERLSLICVKLSVFSEQFAVSKVIRLGKHSEDKDQHGPLLVGLNQESNKLSLLVNSSKLCRRNI